MTTAGRTIAQELLLSGHQIELRHAAAVAEALGIDPDLDIDVLRRRLLWGERVEQAMREDYAVTAPQGRVLATGDANPFVFAASWHAWLTRPEDST